MVNRDQESGPARRLSIWVIVSKATRLIDLIDGEHFRVQPIVLFLNTCFASEQ